MENALQTLLLSVQQFDDAALERVGERWYGEYCVSPARKGEVKTHDELRIDFFPDRFHHSFHTSPDRARQTYSKAKIARDRIERMRWIPEIIAGRILGTECWLVPPDQHRWFPQKRLYILWSEFYVIWLDPKKSGDAWKFSTAYVCGSADIRRYLKGGRKIWAAPMPRPPTTGTIRQTETATSGTGIPADRKDATATASTAKSISAVPPDGK